MGPGTIPGTVGSCALLAIADCIPSAAQPPHPPPSDAPRSYPPHQTYLNSLPDRAAPYRRQQLAIAVLPLLFII